MSDLEEILLSTENSDVIDTSKDDVELHKKRKLLIELINQRKANQLPGKWSVKRLEKALDKVVEKLFNDYKQKELQDKGIKTGEAIGKQVIKIYSNGIEKFINIDSLDNLQKDVEEDMIIKDSLADIGLLMVSTFGKLLLPLLMLCHTANHVQFPILKKFTAEQPKVEHQNISKSEDPVNVLETILI